MCHLYGIKQEIHQFMFLSKQSKRPIHTVHASKYHQKQYFIRFCQQCDLILFFEVLYPSSIQCLDFFCYLYPLVINVFVVFRLLLVEYFLLILFYSLFYALNFSCLDNIIIELFLILHLLQNSILVQEVLLQLTFNSQFLLHFMFFLLLYLDFIQLQIKTFQSFLNHDLLLINSLKLPQSQSQYK